MFLHVYLISFIFLSEGISALKGGTNVEETIPYQVAIFSRGIETVPMCNGALISERLVVTAKSCVSYLPMRFVLGNINVQELEPHEVEMTIDKPEQIFQPPLAFIDVVLVQLPKPLEFNSHIRPIAIGEAGNHHHAIVTSWGERGGHLKKIATKIQPPYRCGINDFKKLILVNKFMLCTFSAACAADTGAPIVVKLGSGSYKLIGILTAFDSKCHGSVDFYTKLVPLRRWIDQVDAMVEEDVKEEPHHVAEGNSESQEVANASFTESGIVTSQESSTESINLEGTGTTMEYADGIESGTEADDFNIITDRSTDPLDSSMDDTTSRIDTIISPNGNVNIINKISSMNDSDADKSPGTDIANADNNTVSQQMVNVSYLLDTGKVVDHDISIGNRSDQSDISHEFISIRMNIKPPLLNQEFDMVIRNSEITKRFTKRSVRPGPVQNRKKNKKGSGKRPNKPIQIQFGQIIMIKAAHGYSRVVCKRRPFCLLHPGKLPGPPSFVPLTIRNKKDANFSNETIVGPANFESEQNIRQSPPVDDPSGMPIYEIFSNGSSIDKPTVRLSHIETDEHIRKNLQGDQTSKEQIHVGTGSNSTASNVRPNAVPSFRLPGRETT